MGDVVDLTLRQEREIQSRREQTRCVCEKWVKDATENTNEM